LEERREFAERERESPVAGLGVEVGKVLMDERWTNGRLKINWDWRGGLPEIALSAFQALFIRSSSQLAGPV
jgi:hypothetical protein